LYVWSYGASESMRHKCNNFLQPTHVMLLNFVVSQSCMAGSLDIFY